MEDIAVKGSNMSGMTQFKGKSLNSLSQLCRVSQRLCICGAISLVTACGGGSSSSSDKDLDDIRTYKTNSSYYATLPACARADSFNDYCTLDELPILGMEYANPGIPQIMERVVVSHDWMGERFEEYLYELPQEALGLFRAITAIVIDDDIRPAYYTTGTGAIYIDPAFLWLSVEEKQTINPKEDYRAGFDDPLAFRQLNRYMLDGERAYIWSSLTDNSTRELEDIVLLISRLVFHELAHANDFFPPDALDEAPTNMTVNNAAIYLSGSTVSFQLADNFPLDSQVMYSLAEVMYLGANPSIAALEITASEVGEAFEPDGAADDYAYSRQSEDLAMLFEATFMKYVFDADYEQAFTGVPEDASNCADYIIGWGLSNRIGDPQVSERAQFVAEALVPEIDLDDFFENLETSQIISGDWCIGASASGSSTSQKPSQPSPISPIDTLRPYL